MKTFDFTTAELEDLLSDGTTGFCLICGEETSGVEPDARKYRCDNCRNLSVYGLEEIMMIGRINLIDEEEEE